MSKYIPRFNAGNWDTLVLDSLFDAEECLEYAKTHKMSVLLTETTSTSSVETMMLFKKNGFSMELVEKDTVAPDGTKLKPTIYVLFSLQDTQEGGA